MIQKCKMLWYNTKNRDLGISDENDHRWVETIFEWPAVVMICEAETEDEASPEFGMTNIFFKGGEYFVVDIPYTEAEKKFLERDVAIIF